MIFNIRKDKVILKCKSVDDAETLNAGYFFISAYNLAEWVIATINPSKVKLNDILQRQEVHSVTYGFEHSVGTLQYPKNQIYVKFSDGISHEEAFYKMGLSESVEAMELYNPNSNLYKITLENILQICRNLFESGLFTCAEPSSFLEIKVNI